MYTCLYHLPEVVAFFSTCSWRRQEIADRKDSYSALFLFYTKKKNDFSKVPKNLARYKNMKIK